MKINNYNIKEKEFRRIPFNTIKEYWIEVDHFKEPGKRIVESAQRLGHFKTPLDSPSYQAYGAFDGDKMIGCTQLVHWQNDWVRYRTVNIREEYRGTDLGWQLIKFGLNDWELKFNYLFGWVRNDHTQWALKHGFTYIDNKVLDDHVGMILDLKSL